MTKNERRRALAAVTRFERAVDELAFKGCAHPDDHPAIERRYALAKANLLRVMGFEVEV
ncbi:MAG TPA: hypothetical protein H9899_07100 [Candidatus Sphingomonas excrementigallinarum]|nr:hypothetical protein [Candidatus Sphingomonas excrementigallinarum]